MRSVESVGVALGAFAARTLCRLVAWHCPSILLVARVTVTSSLSSLNDQIGMVLPRYADEFYL